MDQVKTSYALKLQTPKRAQICNNMCLASISNGPLSEKQHLSRYQSLQSSSPQP